MAQALKWKVTLELLKKCESLESKKIGWGIKLVSGITRPAVSIL